MVKLIKMERFPEGRSGLILVVVISSVLALCTWVVGTLLFEALAKLGLPDFSQVGGALCAGLVALFTAERLACSVQRKQAAPDWRSMLLVAISCILLSLGTQVFLSRPDNFTSPLGFLGSSPLSIVSNVIGMLVVGAIIGLWKYRIVGKRTIVAEKPQF